MNAFSDCMFAFAAIVTHSHQHVCKYFSFRMFSLLTSISFCSWGYMNNLPLVFLQVYLSCENDIPVALVHLQRTKMDTPYG